MPSLLDYLDPPPSDPEMEYGFDHTHWARQPYGGDGVDRAIFDTNSCRDTEYIHWAIGRTLEKPGHEPWRDDDELDDD